MLLSRFLMFACRSDEADVQTYLFGTRCPSRNRLFKIDSSLKQNSRRRRRCFRIPEQPPLPRSAFLGAAAILNYWIKIGRCCPRTMCPTMCLVSDQLRPARRACLAAKMKTIRHSILVAPAFCVRRLMYANCCCCCLGLQCM